MRTHDPAAVLTVYVPANPDHAFGILTGSGIVGDPTPPASPGRVCVDYEGNLYDAENLRTWPERVHHAAGRHTQRYPTVARLWLDPGDLLAVGTYNPQTFQVTIDPDPSDRLERWAGAGVREDLAAYEAKRQARRRDCSGYRFRFRPPPTHECTKTQRETTTADCLACALYDGSGPKA